MLTMQRSRCESWYDGTFSWCLVTQSFGFTFRPMLGALGASLALGGNILGPIIFFVAWNLIRWAFMWYTQEFGYKGWF